MSCVTTHDFMVAQQLQLVATVLDIFIPQLCVRGCEDAENNAVTSKTAIRSCLVISLFDSTKLRQRRKRCCVRRRNARLGEFSYFFFRGLFAAGSFCGV